MHADERLPGKALNPAVFEASPDETAETEVRAEVLSQADREQEVRESCVFPAGCRPGLGTGAGIGGRGRPGSSWRLTLICIHAGW